MKKLNTIINTIIDDVAQEPIIHDAKEMDIFINESLAKDYSISVIYYDEDGSKYQ